MKDRSKNPAIVINKDKMSCPHCGTIHLVGKVFIQLVKEGHYYHCSACGRTSIIKGESNAD